jgi:hypothetical protein
LADKVNLGEEELGLSLSDIKAKYEREIPDIVRKSEDSKRQI